MELAYKPNWAEARPRLEAFWQGELIDRPCIAVTAPLHPRRPVPPPADWRVRWTDPDYVADEYDANHEATWFGGEALPGTSLMVGYCFGYGTRLRYEQQTVWQEPLIADWAAPPDLTLREDDPGWRQVRAVVERCAEVAEGKWMVGFPNVHQPNDHLSLLRGGEAFCLDLLDHPAEVKAALRRLLDNWYTVAGRLAETLGRTQEGSTTWLGIWCPRPIAATLQSDISCTLSPAMFEAFIAPELEEMTRWLDGAVYHLDGPGALQHLERLLAIEQLHAIQWTPGSGQPGGLHWLELYQRIQAAGKGVVPYLRYDEVLPAVRALKPEGLFIQTGAPSVEAGERLLEEVARATGITRWV